MRRAAAGRLRQIGGCRLVDRRRHRSSRQHRPRRYPTDEPQRERRAGSGGGQGGPRSRSRRRTTAGGRNTRCRSSCDQLEARPSRSARVFNRGSSRAGAAEQQEYDSARCSCGAAAALLINAAAEDDHHAPPTSGIIMQQQPQPTLFALLQLTAGRRAFVVVSQHNRWSACAWRPSMLSRRLF